MLKDFLLDSWSLRILNANLRYYRCCSGLQSSIVFRQSLVCQQITYKAKDDQQKHFDDCNVEINGILTQGVQTC